MRRHCIWHLILYMLSSQHIPKTFPQIHLLLFKHICLLEKGWIQLAPKMALGLSSGPSASVCHWLSDGQFDMFLRFWRHLLVGTVECN